MRTDATRAAQAEAPTGGTGPGQRALRFGVFDWVDDSGKPVAQLYDERLTLAQAADKAGLYCYHIAEHHCTPLGLAPSPNVFLAALATRTRRIRLGPLVALLPLYEPLRLINEIAMLDHLSHGRLELGIGKGVSPYELGYHGVDAGDTADIFAETLDILRAAWTQQRLTAGGTGAPRYQDVPLPLRPLQQPHPPLWCPTASPGTASWAAGQRINLMGLGSAETFAPCARAFWRSQAGNPTGPTTTAVVGMNRQIVVAPTDAEAVRIARAAYPRFADNFVKLWEQHGNPRARSMVDLDANLAHGSVIAGSPATVRAEVIRQARTADLNYFSLAFSWGDLPLDTALRSLRLFSEHVVPNVSAGPTSAGSTAGSRRG